jgi:hypothetical protein
VYHNDSVVKVNNTKFEIVQHLQYWIWYEWWMLYHRSTIRRVKNHPNSTSIRTEMDVVENMPKKMDHVT